MTQSQKVRGRGRPALTDAEAWISARKRLYAAIREVTGSIDGEVCYVIRVNEQRRITFAGGRGRISAEHFILADMGVNIRTHLVDYRKCDTRKCLSPDHMVVRPSYLPLGSLYTGWLPDPIPPL